MKIDALLIVGGLMHNPAMTTLLALPIASMTLIKPQGKTNPIRECPEAAEAETTGIKAICTNTFPRNEALEKRRRFARPARLSCNGCSQAG